MALTQESLDGIRQELIERRPRWVVVRSQHAVRPRDWEFVWAPLYTVVTNRYILGQTVGAYEIWRSKQL
jgi:hypothetical protein